MNVPSVTLNDTEEETIRSALPQLLAFNYPNNIHYNMTKLKILQDILVKNDINDMSFVMSEITQSCDEMLLSCSWEKKKVDCAEIFTKSLTADGYCCSFNSGNSRSPSGIFTTYNGLLSSLVIVLNPMIQPVQYSSLHSSGIKVFIHDPTEYPGSQSTIKLISVGRVAYFQILGTKIICSEDVKNLPMSHRHCLYPNEFKLKSFFEYSSSNCLSECVALRFYAYCKCVPFQLAFVGTLNSFPERFSKELLTGCENFLNFCN
nr:sodium channel protein Nach-like [Leptinotarsa decemlineata]